MAEFSVVKESFLRRFLTLEHGIPGVMILKYTISICYVACLSQKHGHVFLGQDTRAKALDPVMSDMKSPRKTTPGDNTL